MSVPPAPPRAPGRRRSARRPRLRDVVADALADVDASRLDLDVPGADEGRALRERLSAQLRTHLLPRLREVDHPALVVFGGSTGAGKSTLVNSLVGAELTKAGVLRPTTRKPVLLVHPPDEPAMAAHPIAGAVVVTAHEAVPAGLALLDTPDLDSVDDANRALGAELLEAADLWVFVTTAARYGDAVPWALLRAAQTRGVTVIVVLNRVREAALLEIREDLLSRLVVAGLGAAPLFVLPDLGPHDGLIPTDRLANLDRWLELLAARTRGALVARTIRGTWPSLRQDLLRLADAVDAQVAAADDLRRRARERTAGQAEAVASGVATGAAALGGPTTRWLALASTGGPLAPLVAGAGRIRSRGRGSRERGSAAVGLQDAVLAAVASMVVDGAAWAARDIRADWAEPGVGGAGVAARVDATAATTARAPRVRAALEAWAESVARDAGAWPQPTGRSGRLLDARGWAALVCAAAAGVDGAARAVDRAFGARGPELRDQARADLVESVRHTVSAEAEPFLTAVEALEVDEVIALGLRVRASELRGVG